MCLKFPILPAALLLALFLLQGTESRLKGKRQRSGRQSANSYINFGKDSDWQSTTDLKTCEPGHVVRTFQLFIDFTCPQDDCSGLRRIEMKCGKPKTVDQVYEPEKLISEGLEDENPYWATEMPLEACYGYFSGFRAWSQGEGGRTLLQKPGLADKWGIMNLQLKCIEDETSLFDREMPQVIRNFDYTRVSDVAEGDWVYCPEGQGICGLQTKLGEEEGDDHNGINNLRFQCCAVAQPGKHQENGGKPLLRKKQA